MPKETTKLQGLEEIEYRRGMLKKGMKPENLPVKIWRGIKIPAAVRAAVNEEELFNLSGVYGDRSAADPVEYDYLKLTLTDATVEITVYNRGLMLFTLDDARVRRIHRALCRLDQPWDD